MSYKVHLQGYIIIDEASNVSEAEWEARNKLQRLKSDGAITIGVRTTEFICDDCDGEGEVSTDEDDGEGHTMRGVGLRKCHCQIDKDQGSLL